MPDPLGDFTGRISSGNLRSFLEKQNEILFVLEIFLVYFDRNNITSGPFNKNAMRNAIKLRFVDKCMIALIMWR